jgi:hypothetical protein
MVITSPANGSEHIGRQSVINYLEKMNETLGRPPTEFEVGHLMAKLAEADRQKQIARGFNLRQTPSIGGGSSKSVEEYRADAARLKPLLLAGKTLKNACDELGISYYRGQLIKSKFLPGLRKAIGRRD